MNIFITGGAGFIGSHLSEKMLSEGNQVTVLDNLSTGKLKNIAHLRKNKNFKFVLGSILNKELLEDIIKKCDQIYHLAAAVGVKYIIDNPLESLRTNIGGTENVLELANKFKKKVLVASTSEIYGKSEDLPFSEESDRLLGSTHISRWSYSSAKAIDEFLALAFYREKKLPVVIVRFFNTVGPRQTGQYGMVIPRFIKNALLNHPISIFGDGNQSRCFADVSDIINAITKLMSCKEAEGRIFNVGSTEEISITDLAKKIKKATNSNSRIDYIKYEDAYEDGFEDMQKRMPDLTRVKETIGYEPQINLDQIIQRVVDFYEK